MDRRTFVAAGAAAAITPSLAGAQDAPAAPIALIDQAQRYLDIMRGPLDDDAAYEAISPILTITFPRPLMPQARETFRLMQFHGPLRPGETTVKFDAYDPRQEAWTLGTLNFETDPRHRITRFDLGEMARPADVAPPPRLKGAALGNAIGERAERLVPQDRFSGTVLVSRRGAVEAQGAWGMADRARKVVNTLDTKFRLGSMPKIFTAVSIMQLAVAGKLDLNTPLGAYIKDYPNTDIARTVTPAHLLTHSGGTGDYLFSPEAATHRQQLREAKNWIGMFGDRPPQFPAGTRQAYSNYGFILLGRIVEMVSGQSYDEYIDAYVFKPAGMTQTGNWRDEAIPGPWAVGYTGQPGLLAISAPQGQGSSGGTSAGGGLSTVADLQRFAQAFMGYRLLDEAHTRRLVEPGMVTSPDGKPFRSDFGRKTTDGRTMWGHGGGAPGMNTWLRMFPDTGQVVAVLCNLDDPSANGMANFICDRLG
jgi:D-alanyl-D-alanine carboxypeptidase